MRSVEFRMDGGEAGYISIRKERQEEAAKMSEVFCLLG